MPITHQRTPGQNSRIHFRTVIKSPLSGRENGGPQEPGDCDIPWVVGLSGGKDSTAVTMRMLESSRASSSGKEEEAREHAGRAPPVIDHVHAFINELRSYVHDRSFPSRSN